MPVLLMTDPHPFLGPGHGPVLVPNPAPDLVSVSVLMSVPVFGNS